MSLRARLFLVLMLATGLVWASATVWVRHSTRAEVERVLDARLSEAAQMVASLLADDRVDLASAAGAVGMVRPAAGYARQLSCQIWALDGALLGRSAGAPDERLGGGPGFSKTRIGDETWRVFTVEDAALGVRVMVGDAQLVRDRLIADVTRGLLLPAAAILPLLAALIWASVGRGLAPLDRMAQSLAARPATDLSPLPDPRAPRELQPVVAALNGLFRRAAAARDAERSFTTFAAHELKTPLAGLRLQADLALRAPDEAARARALSRLREGVDRTDRMVRQLLDLARIGDSDAPAAPPLPMAALVREVAAGLAPLAEARRQAVRLDLAEAAPAPPHRLLFTLALRNLLENALQHAPEGGVVRVSLSGDGRTWTCLVEDSGPGMTPEERLQALRAFWRGPGSAPGGSGLGLTIAAEAAARMGGDLTLGAGATGGEAARLVLPA